MDLQLIKAIEESTLLSKEMKARLLKTAKGNPSPEQIATFMKLLKTAEEKKTDVLAKADTKKAEAVKKYLKSVDTFMKVDVPKARREIEKKIHAGERAEAEQLISDIK